MFEQAEKIPDEDLWLLAGPAKEEPEEIAIIADWLQAEAGRAVGVEDLTRRQQKFLLEWLHNGDVVPEVRRNSKHVYWVSFEKQMH